MGWGRPVVVLCPERKGRGRMVTGVTQNTKMEGARGGCGGTRAQLMSLDPTCREVGLKDARSSAGWAPEGSLSEREGTRGQRAPVGEFSWDPVGLRSQSPQSAVRKGSAKSFWNLGPLFTEHSGPDPTGPWRGYESKMQHFPRFSY